MSYQSFIFLKGHNFKFYSIIIDKQYKCLFCDRYLIIGLNNKLSYFINKDGQTWWPENMPTCNEMIIKDIIE